MNATKIVLFVGEDGLWAKYDVLRRTETEYQVEYLSCENAVLLAKDRSADIALVLIEMRQEHGTELDFRESKDGHVTGLALTRKLLPLCGGQTRLLIFTNPKDIHHEQAVEQLQTESRVIHMGDGFNWSVAQLKEKIESLLEEVQAESV